MLLLPAESFLAKPSKATTTHVTLSSDRLKSAFLIMYSTPIPTYLWILMIGDEDSKLLSLLTSLTLIQTHSAASLF